MSFRKTTINCPLPHHLNNFSKMAAVVAFRAPVTLKSSRAVRKAVAARSRTVMMATYKVTLITPDGKKTISCPDDVYILDKAEVRGGGEPGGDRGGAGKSAVGGYLHPLGLLGTGVGWNLPHRPLHPSSAAGD